jgi:putative inorganic carbon (hco3(-)) transporter
VLTFAVVSGPLPKLGVIAVAVLAAVAILSQDTRGRAWAMLGGLVLSPVLLLGSIWNSPQLLRVHHHPLEAAVAAVFAVGAVCAVAVVIARRPRLLPPLAMLALPFRVPIQTGGSSANLLVPLYLVVAAGALAWIVPRLRDPPAEPEHRERLTYEWLLGAFVVLYAVQALYSDDFQQALQNMVFFYVPFALLLTMLRDLEWDRELITRCVKVTAGLAVAFALIAFYEEITGTILLSSKIAAVNQAHSYFTVNSVFYDPDIFGRYLAIVMVLLIAALLYERDDRTRLVISATLVILWVGLVLTLSRSSMAALLVGMGTLGALRWRVGPVLAIAAAVLVVGGAAIAISPTTFGLNQGLNGASSGRASLVRGGISLFGEKPVWGHGSGSFVSQYRHRYPLAAQTVSASHTIPVTVAEEQGVIGLLVYFALVISAIVTLLRGARADPPRVAIAAAFLALLLHTLLYAAFLEDPITWTLLGIGAALTVAQRGRRTAEDREAERLRRAARAAPTTAA